MSKLIGFVYFGPNDAGMIWARGVVYECRIHNRKHSVEFRPVIGPPLREDTERAMASQPIADGNPIWTRVSGETIETIETITLTPSIQQACCHCVISNGEMLP